MLPLRRLHTFNLMATEMLIYTDYVRGGVLKFAPGFAADRHYHERADEIFWFFEGTCHITTADEDVLLPAGSIVYTPADEWHIIANDSGTPLRMFLAVTPNVVPSHTFYNPDGTPYARSMKPLTHY
jgi:quercetin dioxygenase-like cupin family protein